MKSFHKILMAAAIFAPARLFACAACGSESGNFHSSLSDGMNMGILTLLGVLLTVLTCAAVFFVNILRKDETASQNSDPALDLKNSCDA